MIVWLGTKPDIYPKYRVRVLAVYLLATNHSHTAPLCTHGGAATNKKTNYLTASPKAQVSSMVKGNEKTNKIIVTNRILIVKVKSQRLKMKYVSM